MTRETSGPNDSQLGMDGRCRGAPVQDSRMKFGFQSYFLWLFALVVYLEGGWLTGVSLSVGQKQTEALVARGRAGSLNGSRQILTGFFC